MDFETWGEAVEAGKAARLQKDNSQWQLGDLGNEVISTPLRGRPAADDDRQTQTAYAEEIGIERAILSQYMNVSKFYKNVERSTFNLSWSYFERAYRLFNDIEDACDWLQRAQDNEWSVRDMVDEIKSNGKGPKFSPMIKPSDNWNFRRAEFQRPNNSNGHGYIPGEIYANVFWYYVQPGDLVVDPMAGSGMAQVVYEARHEWMNGHRYDFDLRLFDLTPQQNYIQQHNLLDGFPVDHPDYIFMDVPYYGMVEDAYSDSLDDLANLIDYGDYLDRLTRIAHVCYAAQSEGQLCTIMSPNYLDWRGKRRVMVALDIADIWRRAGYEAFDMAFSTRRIQQTQHPSMARLNNDAKEKRLMLSDIAVLATFRRGGV